MSDFFDQLIASGTQKQQPPADAPEDQSSSQQHESSTTITAKNIKKAVQELMKFGYLEASRRPNLYQQSVVSREQINQILEPLDLKLTIDDIRGLAFLVVSDLWQNQEEDGADSDEWTHPLVRRQRITMEQSLLIAILRQQYIAHEQEAGIGASDARVDIEELLSQLQVYLGDMGSDSRERKRLDNLLDKLSIHGLVSVDDKQQTVAIRPIITHLANPESLQTLLNHFKQSHSPSDDVSTTIVRDEAEQ
ncbi:DUF4194 domain-containing protein [Endozoicomonas sp. 2B-B]